MIVKILSGVGGTAIEDLTGDINEALNDGWTLYGNPFATETLYEGIACVINQMMVRGVK